MQMAKILILGDDRNYFCVNSDYEKLKETVPDVFGNSRGMTYGEKLLEYIAETENPIPAKQLTPYGGTIPLESSDKQGNIIDKVHTFFEDAKKKAEIHNAQYVLVQLLNLNPNNVLGSNVSGLVQLLIE